MTPVSFLDIDSTPQSQRYIVALLQAQNQNRTSGTDAAGSSSGSQMLPRFNRAWTNLRSPAREQSGLKLSKLSEIFLPCGREYQPGGENRPSWCG